MCKVSIILPTYNRKYCIAGAIDSVLRQTWQDYELIIVDDGSTDGTEEYVRGIPDERIRYIRNPGNAGAGGARNIGIREAAGRYIAFQDSDTHWMAGKLERQVAYMDTADPSVAMVYSPYEEIYKDHTMVYPALNVPLEEKSGYILPILLDHPLIGTPTMLVRKEALMEVGGFDASMRALEDYELSIRIAQKYQIGIIDEVLLTAYDGQDSISNDTPRYIQDSFYLLGKHRKLFDGHQMTMVYLNQLSRYAVRYQQLDYYVQCLQEMFQPKPQ